MGPVAREPFNAATETTPNLVFIDDAAYDGEGTRRVRGRTERVTGSPGTPRLTRVIPPIVDEERARPLTIEIRPAPGASPDVTLSACTVWPNIWPNCDLVPINDSGLDGDRVSGDGIWTARYRREAGEDPELWYQVKIPGTTYQARISGPLILPAEVPKGRVRRVSSTLQYSSSVINLADPAALRDATNEFVVSGSGWLPRAATAAIQARLEPLTGHADFWAYVNAGRWQAHDNRNFRAISNPVQGIGRTFSDVPGLPFGEIRWPLLHLFPGALSHEVGHAWLVFLPEPFSGASGAHWPFGTAGACSPMGIDGFGPWPRQLRREGRAYIVECEPCSGDPAAEFEDSVQFNDVELYLMGLLPADQANDRVFNFLDQKQDFYTCGARLKGGVKRFGVSNIRRALGPRIPDAAEAPKSFKVRFVVLSERLLTRKTMRFLDAQVGEAVARFAFNTRGLGTIDPSFKVRD